MEENYFKLLDYQEKLQKTDEYLSLEKEKELLNYESQISDHLRWKKKNHFIEVMVDFLEDTIDFDQYIDCFYKMDYEIQEYKEKLKSDFEKLRAFEPDLRSKGFAILIENLFSDIRVLEPDDKLRTKDEISEKSLRDGIKKFLPKIKKY